MKKKKLYGVLGLTFCLLAMGCGSRQEGNSTEQQNTADTQTTEQISQAEAGEETDTAGTDMSNWDDMYFFDFYNPFMYVRPAGDNIYLVQMEKAGRWDSGLGTIQDVGFLTSDEEDDREIYLAVNDYKNEEYNVITDIYGVSLDGVSDLVKVPEALKPFIAACFEEARTKNEGLKYSACDIENSTITKVEEVSVSNREMVRFEGFFEVVRFDHSRENSRQTIQMTGYVTYLKNGNPVWAVACDATDDNRHAEEIDEYAKKCIGSLYEPTQKHIEEDWPGHVFH